MSKGKKKIVRKKKSGKSTTKKRLRKTPVTKKPVKKTKTKSKKAVKPKVQKTKKRITHKLTYKPIKAIKHTVQQGEQQRLGNGKSMGYEFRPDKKPDKTPSRIRDVGTPNLKTQLVRLKCKKLGDLPIIRTPDTAADILNNISKNDREVVQVLYLNNKNKVIGIETAHKGSVNASITAPHEIMKTALLTNASAIIFAHNHPSGDPTPSEEDIAISKRLKESGKTVDVKLLDSIIIGHGKYYSLNQEGKM